MTSQTAASTAASRVRTDLLDAADRVIQRLGPNAPMAQIAAEAGITKPILYRHFGSKSGLYQALAERYTDPLLTQIRRAVDRPGTPQRRVRAGIDAYLRFIEAYPARYRFLMHRATGEDPVLRSTVSAFSRRVGDEVAVALRQVLGDAPALGEPTAVWGQAIVGLVQVAGDWWLDQAGVPRERMAAHLTRLLWDGLSAVAAGAPNRLTPGR